MGLVDLKDAALGRAQRADQARQQARQAQEAAAQLHHQTEEEWGHERQDLLLDQRSLEQENQVRIIYVWACGLKSVLGCENTWLHTALLSGVQRS